jgi:hypothetical protein
MPGFKDKDFNERRASAADARKAMLDRFKAQVNDPALAQRRAERAAIAAAREQRQAERQAAKEAEALRQTQEAERLAAEQAAR